MATREHVCRPLHDKEKFPPLYSEVAKAINELKANKSPGFDVITEELAKCGDKNVINYFLKLCTSIWLKIIWQDDWIKSVFMSNLKKGDTLQCCNNRTIPFISHWGKFLLKVTAGRLQAKVKKKLVRDTHAVVGIFYRRPFFAAKITTVSSLPPLNNIESIAEALSYLERHNFPLQCYLYHLHTTLFYGGGDFVVLLQHKSQEVFQDFWQTLYILNKVQL